MTKASDLFIQCLEEEGVEYVFGVPGEENLDFLDSLSRSNRIKLILTRHEQGAGFMAATYGRHTGKTGVCVATLGPGATNFVTAAAYAQLGGMPILMVTGQKPIKKSKQGRFQIIDVVEMMGPVTKFTHQLASADNIPSRIREAFRLAEEEKPGATHIEFPEDIAEEQTDSTPLKRSLVRRPNADAKAVRAAVEKLEGARSPILVIGAGANRKMTSRMLLQLIEKTGIPFITTQLGKGVIDETHPKFLGCAALSSGDFCHKAIEAADVIVNIGHDVIEKPPFFMQRGGADVIHVSTITASVDPVYFPQIEVVGDIANAIWQIREDIVPSATWNFDRMMKAREAEIAHTSSLCGDDRYPIFPPCLVGVGCESCHGPASNWLHSHYAVGGTHADNVARGLVPLDNPQVRAGQCLDCHFGGAGEGQFVTHRIMAAGHPRISFELDLFSTLQQHYNFDGDYAQRKSRASSTQIWAIGQAMALDRALSLFTTARGTEGMFPEFYFFDCHSCHRRISDDPRFRPAAPANPGRPIPAGVPPFNDENMIMLSAAARVIAPGLAARFERDSRAFHAAIARDRGAAIAAAQALRASARALADAFTATQMGPAQTFAIIDAITATALRERFTDYAGSVQAVMATDTLLSALVNQGQVSAGAASGIRGDINAAYRAVHDPNDYDPVGFRSSLGRAAAAIRRLR